MWILLLENILPGNSNASEWCFDNNNNKKPIADWWVETQYLMMHHIKTNGANKYLFLLACGPEWTSLNFSFWLLVHINYANAFQHYFCLVKLKYLCCDRSVQLLVLSTNVYKNVKRGYLSAIYKFSQLILRICDWRRVLFCFLFVIILLSRGLSV